MEGIMKENEQAVHVIFQPENAPVIKADALKNTVAVKCAMIKHGGLGFLLFH